LRWYLIFGCLQEGLSHDHGIYFRAFEELYDLSNANTTYSSKFYFHVSIFELHNEQVCLYIILFEKIVGLLVYFTVHALITYLLLVFFLFVTVDIYASLIFFCSILYWSLVSPSSVEVVGDGWWICWQWGGDTWVIWCIFLSFCGRVIS